MSDEKCPGCGSPVAKDRPGCRRWDCGRLRDKNTGHVYETPDCLRRQLHASRQAGAQPPICWCGTPLKPAHGQPGTWNPCDACMELIAEGAAEKMHDENERLRKDRADMVREGVRLAYDEIKADFEEDMKRLQSQDEEITRLRGERLSLARLAADEPQFFNPLRVAEVQQLRDAVLREAAELARQGGADEEKPDDPSPE